MVDPSLMETPITYHPYQAPPRDWVGGASLYRYDHCKLNVLWLVHPVVDQVWDKRWGGDPISALINDQFSRTIRHASRSPPWDFCQEWGQFLAYTFDLDHGTIVARAKAAQHRLFPGTMGSAKIIYVDFKGGKR